MLKTFSQVSYGENHRHTNSEQMTKVHLLSDAANIYEPQVLNTRVTEE